jgi:hypothetical protein
MSRPSFEIFMEKALENPEVRSAYEAKPIKTDEIIAILDTYNESDDNMVDCSKLFAGLESDDDGMSLVIDYSNRSKLRIKSRFDWMKITRQEFQDLISKTTAALIAAISVIRR